MTEFNFSYSLPEMSGINVADKPDSLSTRGNQELADLRNLDFYKRGIGKRKGSVSLDQVPFETISWSEIVNPNNFGLGSIAYDPTADRFVAVGADEGAEAYIITSDDSGATWTDRTNSHDAGLNEVAFGESTWVAVGSASGGSGNDTIISSGDGTTWTGRTSPHIVTLNDVAYGNDNFIAVANNLSGAPNIITSADGFTWAQATVPSTNENVNLLCVAYDGVAGRWIVGGSGSTSGNGWILFSDDDGSTWTALDLGSSSVQLGALQHNETYWIAVGNADGTDAYIIKSLDGITWVEQSNPTNIALLDVHWEGSHWVAVGNPEGGDAYIISSPDGETWTESSNPGNQALGGVASNGKGIWVAVGNLNSAGSDAYIVKKILGDIVAGIEWRSPSDGSRIQILLGTETIFVKESATWAQINNSGSTAYTHDSPVTKGMFAQGDGHLFIFMDGANNEIQVYKVGADLDPEMKNGNTYEDAFGAGTNAMTGVWPTAAYMGAYINGRLAWSDGNVLVEFTNVANATGSGIWDLASNGAGFYRAGGNVTALVNFIPHLTNSIQESLFIGTVEGWEHTTGFLSFDRIVRIQGSNPPLNHKAFFKSRSWLVYLSDDMNIMAINRNAAINLGRRFKEPADRAGPLDGMIVSNSETNSFGFYDRDRERGYLAITTNAANINDTWLVLDFKKGEPQIGEPLPSFEQRVRCLVWNLGAPSINEWFITVYQTSDGPVGVLKARAIYTMESGDDDLGDIAISAYGALPIWTGDGAALPRQKQWGQASLRAVANSGTTLTLESFNDWADQLTATPEFTASRTLAADTGDIAAFTRSIAQQGEAVQLKFSNAEKSKGFIIQSVGLTYAVGEEIQGA